MTSATHPVSAEEVMEYLDGECSAAGAEEIRCHINTCAECAAIANQLRATSQSLAQWSVPAAPGDLDGFVRSAATDAAAGRSISKPKSIFTRAAFWSRSQWAFSGAAAFACVLVLFATLTLRQREPSPARMSMYFSEPSRSHGQGKEDAYAYENAAPAPPQPQPQPTGGQESKRFARAEMAAKLFSPPPSVHAPGDVISGNASPAVSANTPAPMIARTASLSITVKDFAASRSALDAILARHHGYAAELTLSTPENSARSFFTSLRIPQAELAAAVADLRTLGRVEFEKQTGEEVTQQHADLVARLKNSREEESRLQAILQQRTGKIEDVLQVEEEIARVRGEIESMEADQKALEHRVDFASVDLELKEEYKARLDAPSNSAATRLHNAAVNGLHYAWDVSLGIVLWFVEYGPMLLVYLVLFGIPAYFLWRRYRKMRARL
jgi:hypothetical protein